MKVYSKKKFSASNVFDLVNLTILAIIGCAMVYPFIWVISTSISDPALLTKDSVKLLPLGIQFNTYGHIFGYSNLWISYNNTVQYAGLGTIITIFITSLSAYVLSIKRYKPGKVITIIFMLTMFFNGGMVPTYLLISSLNMLDTIWAIIIPPAMNLWYILILRTSFSAISEEIKESARIDGANDFRIYWQLVMPLSKATLATIALFAVTAHWNSFFAPLIYLNNENKFPLTVFLRNLLITRQASGMVLPKGMTGNLEILVGFRTSVRMACIIVTILPIVLVYPFVQKYFVRGVMIGAIKG